VDILQQLVEAGAKPDTIARLTAEIPAEFQTGLAENLTHYILQEQIELHKLEIMEWKPLKYRFKKESIS